MSAHITLGAGYRIRPVSDGYELQVWAEHAWVVLYEAPTELLVEMAYLSFEAGENPPGWEELEAIRQRAAVRAMADELRAMNAPIVMPEVNT